MRLSSFCLAIACLCSAATHAQVQSADTSEPTAADLEFFEKQVRPVLVDNCFECHGPDTQEAGLRLDSRGSILKGGDTGPAIIPGKPGMSELISAINYGADGYQMPPSGKLEAEAIEALTKWVGMGAPWPGDQAGDPAANETEGINLAVRAKHWSFQPITHSQPPPVSDARWCRAPVDRFILAELEAQGLRPATETDRRTLLRRVTYDLIGLPPTPAEMQRFLNDASPNAYEQAVDRLLASPRYGERWGRHWLDLVRFAETGGHEFDYDILHAWRYRDYVIRAFNEDVAYDQFAIEHIAGDLLDVPRRDSVSGRNESVIGTGFYWFGQGKHSPVDLRAEECDTVDNQLDVLGKTFLGLTIACARCHDHKFDPITTRDYYALAGFLQSSRRQTADVNPPEPTESAVSAIHRLQAERTSAVTAHLDRLRPHVDNLGATLLAAAEASTESSATPTPVLEEWKESLRATAENPQDLLHPWSVLAAAADPAEFARLRGKLLSRRGRQQQATAVAMSHAVVFEDFESDGYEGWRTAGFAFGTGPTGAGELLFDATVENPQLELLPRGLAHSGRISGRLHGTLRSATFTVDKQYIHYRVARHGGKKAPGRQLKNGEIHLIADGFQYIRNPLYGHFTINVPNDGVFRWHTQDLGKFQGKTAYIEIADEDDGWIVVDSILFSDASHPPESANAASALLDTPPVSTVSELAGAYTRLFQTAVDLWKSDQLSHVEDADPYVEVLNWLLNDNPLVSAETSSELSRTLADLGQAQRAIEARIPTPTRTVAMIDGTPENEHVLIRGNPAKPGEEVQRRFLEVFTDEEQPAFSSHSGRLELAHNIVAPDNPLTARVLVNRLWHYHFGRGLVASVDNFGVLGDSPTHPQLLDYLADEFQQSGWSIKHMQRMLVCSTTYRMSSAMTDEAVELADPSNKLLHRMPVRRLEGEVIRDSVLALSGRLDRKMFGRSVPPHLSEFMEGRGRPARSGPLDGDGRASIYISVRRNFLTPMFLAFDYPTPFTTVGRRSVSNVPAQALTLMNNPFILEQAGVWAERLVNETQGDIPARIEHVYESALGRLPTDAELAEAVEFVSQSETGPDDVQTWTDFCHVLMNVKEFVFIH